MVQFEAAIMARLGAATQEVSTDPVLAALAPGGVHSRVADEEDAKPFLVLTLIRMDEDKTFSRTWRYRFRYGLSATDESPSIDAASAALQRVYELLDRPPDDQMLMEDFTLGTLYRFGRTGLTPANSGNVYQRITDEYRGEVYPK
jgi:hypothetical protein